MNVAEPEPPLAAVAVTVALKVPAVVGVPETVPDDETEMPGGRPVPVQVYGAVPPVADSVNDEIAVPTVPRLGARVGDGHATGRRAGRVGGLGRDETASHAALTVLNSVQLPGNRFLAAVSVQVRYFR